MKTLILCDRYNKGEAIVAGLKFDDIRNVLNKYNTKNLNVYMSNIANSFLYLHFYMKYAYKSCKDQTDVD